MLSGTDFVYIGPVVTLMHFLRVADFNLRVLPAPEEVSPFTASIIWHHGTHTDPFLQWVRGVLLQSAREEARRFNAIEE